MTEPLPFDVAPWSIGLSGLDESQLAHRESVFALSNGHVGWRGTLDEGDPHGITGSYLNGVFERHPMPYAEAGYGYPSSGESVINVPNGKVIRLFVDDEPFDVRRGTVHRHEQRLDFRDGTLHREVDWTSPAGVRVRIRSTRLVSLAHRSVGAVRYVVESVDADAVMTVQSELVANEDLPEVHPDDRVKEVLDEPLAACGSFVLGTAATLVHETYESGQRIAVAMDHAVSAPGGVSITTEVDEHLARTTISARLAVGEQLEVVKVVGHEWSETLDPPALRDRADAAVDEALGAGWAGLAAGQRERLDAFWECADVEVDGAPRLQQAVRFALFHVFQSAARLEIRSVPGKGLTGAGYEGHTFWDFEGFVLPVLTSTAPEAARQALLWRHATLDHARERARQLKLAGAAFAWRTIDGRESSGYWPASTVAFHLNADIAAAVLHYVRATGDDEFLRDVGIDLLVETARLWLALGRWDDDGVFHLDGVTGPDEYTAVVDDNAFTNLMAAQNLAFAAAAARRHPERARALGVGDDEIEAWERAAGAVALPFDERLGVHAQSARFTQHARWDFDAMTIEQYPLQEHFPYFDLYRKQVVKQADLTLAMFFAPEAFTPEQKAANFAYYEELTVRDSSLSAAVQAVIAAEVGQLELAADYLAEAATLDLDDLHENTDEGLHMASLAGIWTALTCGFGGMRDSDAGMRFAPRLPPQLTRMTFGIKLAGHTLRLDVRPDATTYRLSDGPPVTVHHFGEPVELLAGHPLTCAAPPLPDPGPRPTQPRHRAPRDFADALGA
ncbi:glycoside hydrolase family 65 protein [Agromyces aerolatus]|uniref:glycoside hydrolase family 65 protein n=1 Tax=Agromyces sp. LY-1074 TaxID=3074080 RepID=UPI002862DAF3|nr:MULTISPECIES: glycosyl hydrolase family 65 protein [unclassified Agromyces]MDR5699571.1 glycosyl hydrolase family 65 protein [Agromyces sp. LY-1074]MDR5705867.1 glycosyl hydrolase family 65 protein [Agromyces sp. LY-1358]